MRVRDAGNDSSKSPTTQPDEDQKRAAKRTNSRPPVIERRRQKIIRDPDSQVLLEPVQDRRPYDLSYAFVLIPRFSSHFLIGDIAESLHGWMSTICLSFAWRLEHIAIQPDYMQWVVFVPPATPPSRCIRTVREHTSRQIFEDFPVIRKQNLSDDFWAPGYLVIGGPAPHPPEMIKQYIRLTRQEQGDQPRLGD